MNNPTKIAWASPFSPASEISAFTRNLLPHLRQDYQGKRYETSLFVNDNARRYPTDTPTFSLNGDSDFAGISSVFDHCILNIGNNRENHEHIFSFLKQVPSIVVFHDYVYQHMIAWDCFENKKSRELYGYLMCGLYGEEAIKVLESSRICSPQESNRIYAPWDSPVSSAFPMAQLFIRLASAVIVHSEFSERLVRSVFDGPVLRLQLPSDHKICLSDAEICQWQEATRTRHRLNAVSFGHITRQKCLHLTIEAMADSAVLREHMQYTIVGHPGDKRYVEELQKLTRFHGLINNVRFEFGVTDDRLLQIKWDADLFVNIRFPNTEGGSASLVEQMNTGKPVVVANTGCYSEMPDEAVLKINDYSKPGELIQALEMLIANPDVRVSIGSAAVSFIRRNDGASYVKDLKDFLEENRAVLERRRRDTHLRITKPETVQITSEDTDAVWRRSLIATRASWMASDYDPHVWSPQPFIDWPPSLASRFAASILLNEYHNDELVKEISDQLQIDPITFYERFTELRTLYELASSQEPPANIEIVKLRPNTSLLFWRLAILLRPSVFIRICFLGLYARTWTRSEAARLENYYESTAEPVEVVVEFLNSPEFLALGLKPEAYEQLLEWVEQKILATLAGKLPPCGLGSLLDFSSDSPGNQIYLNGPWYKAEISGTWSLASGCGIVIPIPDSPFKDIGLEFKLRTVGTDVTGPMDIRIYLKNRMVNQASLQDDEMTTIRLTLPKELIRGDSVIRLVFQTGGEVIPKNLGISDDNRALGVLLNSLVLNSA